MLAIDDAQLIALLRESGRDGLELSLIRSDRALTDCRPVLIISIHAVRQLGQEVGVELDKRRLHASVSVNLTAGSGFGEDEWVGRRLRIGVKADVAMTDRDLHCKMITLDPDTQTNPEVMRRVAKGHNDTAGTAVLVEGVIHAGDEIALLD
jgi:MOSC domain-containing protein